MLSGTIVIMMKIIGDADDGDDGDDGDDDDDGVDGDLVEVELEIKLKVPVVPLPGASRGDDNYFEDDTIITTKEGQ